MVYPADVKFVCAERKSDWSVVGCLSKGERSSENDTYSGGAERVQPKCFVKMLEPRCNSGKHLCHHNDLLNSTLHLPSLQFLLHACLCHRSGPRLPSRKVVPSPKPLASSPRPMMIPKDADVCLLPRCINFPHRHDSDRPRTTNLETCNAKVSWSITFVQFRNRDAGFVPRAKVGLPWKCE